MRPRAPTNGGDLVFDLICRLVITGVKKVKRFKSYRKDERTDGQTDRTFP